MDQRTCPACGRAECIGEEFCGYTGQRIAAVASQAAKSAGIRAQPSSGLGGLAKAGIAAVVVVTLWFASPHIHSALIHLYSRTFRPAPLPFHHIDTYLTEYDTLRLHLRVTEIQVPANGFAQLARVYYAADSKGT